MVQLARTRLYEDDAFCKLVHHEDRRQDFITAITEKSQGVFLWTVLAVREMVREAHQAGTMDELKDCLESLPVELGGSEGLYQRIVERSNPRYQKYMARLLLVMLDLEHDEVFWGDVYFLYHDTRDATFVTRECLVLDDKYRLAWDKKAEAATLQPLVAVSRTRDASCRGLFLACHEGRSGAHPRGVNCQVQHIYLEEDTRRQIRKWCPDFVDISDGEGPLFSHRSVEDYLSLPEVRERMIDLSQYPRANDRFDPVLTRCRLRLAHSRLHGYLGDLERDFMGMIARVGHERRDFVRAILPEFERIQGTKWSMASKKTYEDTNNLDMSWAQYRCFDPFKFVVLHGGFDINRSSQAHAWFLSLVAEVGLVWYCREQWSLVPASDRQATGIIIIAVLLLNATHLWAPSRDQIDWVQCLLRSGVDPNAKYTFGKRLSGQYKASIWEAYIEVFPHFWTSRNETKIWRALEMMQLLLHDGRANRECRLPAGKVSLLSALTFEPHRKGNDRCCQYHWWSMFAGQLHNLLDAHGLLTPEERQVALEQGWLSTKLKSPRSPQTTPTQSATEPDARPFSGWLWKLKEWAESIRPYL
jgi:hypothetical protein